jgi:hypothetical protein
MTDFTESGLTISLPDGYSFRFQDLSAYTKLKGQNLKEVDYCWWDDHTHTFWLLEVKDYSNLTTTEKLPNNLLETLTNKVTDSLLILSAAWSNTNTGNSILSELPTIFQTFPKSPDKMKIVCVLKLLEHHKKVELGTLRTKFKNSLEGRIALFDLKQVTLTDHETAIKMGIPIISVT